MKSTRATTRKGGVKRGQQLKEPAVTLTNLKRSFRVDKRGLVSQVKKILTGEKKGGEIEIVLAGDTLLRHLNREFAGKDKTTDVLSFSWQESLTPERKLPFLGEIYISLEQAKRQAKTYEASFPQELLRLVTHGALHLLGYDHKKKKDGNVMRKKEEEYLYAG